MNLDDPKWIVVDADTARHVFGDFDLYAYNGAEEYDYLIESSKELEQAIRKKHGLFYLRD